MKAAAAPIQISDFSSQSDLDFDPCQVWKLFCQRISKVVGDCNTVAGEKLWTIAESEASTLVESDAPARLTVCAITDVKNCVELRFDPDTATLCCTFGRVVNLAAEWLFQVLPGEQPLLRCAGIDVTLDEAVNFTLDRLSFPDE